MSGILVWGEHRAGALVRGSREALAAAQKLVPLLGGPVATALVDAPESAVQAAADGGSESVWSFEARGPGDCALEVLVRACVGVIAELAPAMVLFADGTLGRDVGARVSARLGVALATACADFVADGTGVVAALRPVYGGKFVERVSWLGTPRLATVRGGDWGAPAAGGGRSCTVQRRALSGDARSHLVSVAKAAPREGGLPDLDEARIVVAAGRGIGTAAGVSMVEDLARALRAAVGASRAVVDLGWLDHQKQVGQTGRSVAPDLYVACGISGAVQHLAGIASARTVVAINKDREAPIFGAADYGLVGDLEEVLPRLTAAVRKRGAGKGRPPE